MGGARYQAACNAIDLGKGLHNNILCTIYAIHKRHIYHLASNEVSPPAPSGGNRHTFCFEQPELIICFL